MDEAVKEIARQFVEASAILHKAQAAYEVTLNALNKRLATEGPLRIGDKAVIEMGMFSRKEKGKQFLIERIFIRVNWSNRVEIVASGSIIKKDGSPGVRLGQRVLEVKLQEIEQS